MYLCMIDYRITDLSVLGVFIPTVIIVLFSTSIIVVVF